jgi:predicted acetyltransferase
VSADLLFRGATPDDAPALAANSLRSYPMPGFPLETRVQRYLEGPWPIDSVFVAERDGAIVGQGRTLDFRVWYGGVEAAVGGLAGVAVAPEARRSGVAAAIVRHHVAQCRERGAPWSLLYPFSPTFYAAHGWGPSARRLRWRVRPSAIPAHPERRLVRRAPSSEAVRACYERHCVATSGSLSRSERWWRFDREKPSESKLLVGVGGGDGDGALGGYLIYEAHAPTMRPQTLIVHELVALDPAAERALLGFIAAQSDQFEIVLLDTPVEHPLPAILDPGLPEREDELMPSEHHPLATLYSGLMARVIDLRAALVARGYPGRTGQVAIAVTADALLPENVATATLTVEDGAASARPGRARGATLVSGPVGAISTLLTGGVGLAAAARAGLVAVDGDVATADALLALPVPYPLVYF